MTLYVLVYNNDNTNAAMQLYVLQRTHAYDDATRATTAHLQALYPTATVIEYSLPTELKSDFALFSCLCKLLHSGTPEPAPAAMTSMRDKAVHFAASIRQLPKRVRLLVSNDCGMKTHACVNSSTPFSRRHCRRELSQTSRSDQRSGKICRGQRC